MRVNYQVSVDCADPHVLARFWADALGWQVEDVSGQVKALLDRGVVTEADTATVEGQLAWREFSAVRDPDAAVDGHGLPERGRLIFQLVPEPKTAKNRMHLDLHLEVEDREAEVARLVGLGATKLWEGQQGRATWVTMADPEGNEFCVA